MVHAFPNSDNCSVPCNLCGSTTVSEVRTRDRDGHYLRSVICEHCGLVWTDPRPNPEQVRSFYEKEYRIDYKGSFQPKPKHIFREGQSGLNRFRRIQHCLTPNAKVFDVGAGGGGFIYVLRSMGYDATGLEPNEGYARFASDVLKVPVKFGFYQDAAVPRESQDIITMFHVVEHLESPADVIKVVWDWIRPNGFLVIEVPNVEAVCQHPHTQFHIGHLYHFNLVTLQKLGETHGYCVVESFTSSDGGNIAVVFRKTDNSFKGSSEIPKNYDRVRTVLKRHTGFRHFCSGYPFIRPIQKAYQRLRELWWVQSNKSPKELLDALVNSELGRAAGTSMEQKHD